MKSIVVEGQLSLFETPPSIYSNVVKAKEENKDNLIFKDLVNKYRDTCSRIAQVEKKLYIEIGDETISFEPNGEPGGTFIRDMFLRPKDKILVANEYKPITDEQIKIINRITDIDKFIKRKGYNNILIQYDGFCMAIYPSGNMYKWRSPAVYEDDEVYSIDEIENINKINIEIAEDPKPHEIKDDECLKLRDKVRFDYHGPKEGEIVRIYNNGETVNVSWDNKQTAFYYKSVTKINA